MILKKNLKLKKSKILILGLTYKKNVSDSKKFICNQTC